MKQEEQKVDEIAKWNIQVIIAFALLLIVFLLAYIASK